MCRAWLIRRFPARESRWRIWSPEETSIGAARLEQADVMLLAPAGELAQVQRIRLAGQAGVTARNPAKASCSGSVNTESTAPTTADVDVVAMRHLPGRAETPGLGQPRPQRG